MGSLPLSWMTLSRHLPVHEVSRDEGSTESIFQARRRQDGVDANHLPPDEAVRLSRDIRSRALRKATTDSTPSIRTDRDGR